MKKGLISSKKQVVLIISIFVIPLVVFILLYNLYTVNVLNSETAKTYRNTLFLYQQNLERDMERIELSLIEFWIGDDEHKALYAQLDEISAHVNTLEILGKYKSIMKTYDVIGAMFIATENNNLYRANYQTEYPHELRNAMEEHVKAQVKKSNEIDISEWYLFKYKERSFLVRAYGRSGAYNFCFIDFQHIVKPQDVNNNTKESFLLFSTKDGTPITEMATVLDNHIQLQPNNNGFYISGTKNKFFIVQEALKFANINIIYINSINGYFNQSNNVQILLLASSILILFLIPLSFTRLVKSYFRPFESLIETIEKLTNGEWDATMEQEYRILEFNKISVTLSKMLEKIKNLKIVAYEQELKKQKAELNYLQLQIKPHFFLNCLKTLYGMLEQEKIKDTQEMILNVSTYLRYSMEDHFGFVTLQKEMNHVVNYIQLQKNRIAKKIETEIEIEESISSYLIPALTIQIFVENCFKHAMRPDVDMHISIHGIQLITDEGNYIDILLQDNGPGFPVQYLDTLNQSDAFSYQSEHIGILNVKQRLQIIYGDRAQISFMNNTVGSRLEIIIPTDTPDEWKER